MVGEAREPPQLVLVREGIHHLLEMWFIIITSPHSVHVAIACKYIDLVTIRDSGDDLVH